MSLFHTQNKQPQIVRSVSYPYRTHSRTVRPTARPTRLKALPGLVVVASLLLVGWFFATPEKHNSSVQSTHSSEEQAAPKPEPIKPIDFTTMGAAIDAEILKYPRMDVGVAVVDIKTGEAHAYGVENPFVAASTAKLLTAIAYLHDVEQGKNTLTQQVGGRSAQEALQALIVESDNQAWDALNNRVMSHAELAAYAASVGLTNYNPDTNTITPENVAKLLSNFYQYKLLNKQHTDLLLSFMAQAKEVEFITNTVPAGTKVYHKPGWLADRVHDATIIDNGKRPYVLVVFSKSRTSSYNMTHGEALFKQVTLASLQAFSQ